MKFALNELILNLLLISVQTIIYLIGLDWKFFVSTVMSKILEDSFVILVRNMKFALNAMISNLLLISVQIIINLIGQVIIFIVLNVISKILEVLIAQFAKVMNFV
jgi:hypothetical protein